MGGGGGEEDGDGDLEAVDCGGEGLVEEEDKEAEDYNKKMLLPHVSVPNCALTCFECNFGQ